MKKIIVADYAGFCFGVARAIRMAEEQAQKQKIVCWGPLIHNRQEVDRLEKLGVKTVAGDIIPVPGGDEAVFIRAHGVGPRELESLKEKGWLIIDATCPYVQKAQEKACQAKEEGYQVVILGDKDHAEVRGLRAWTGDTAIVAASPNDLEGVPLPARVAVLAQTTEKEERFTALVEYLQKRVPHLKVLPTICTATRQRQQAAAELAQKADLMIIVGGRHSSNTNKLWEICRKINPESYLVEKAEELNPCWFENKNTIGITGGASTPAWIIKEVVERMEEMVEQKDIKCSDEQEQGKAAGEVQQPDAECSAAAQKEKSAAGVKEESMPVLESAGLEQDSLPVSEAAGPEPDRKPGRNDLEKMDEQLNFRSFKTGDFVKGKVVKVKADEVLVDIGGKSEGIISAEELSYRRVDPRDYVSVGQEITVEFLKEDKEGNIILSHKRARVEEALNRLEEAQKNGTIIQAPVIEIVKGGLLVDVGIRGFVPASQVGRSFVEDMSQYLNQVLRMKVLELDRNKKKAVLSQKVVLEEEYRQKKAALWAELAEGQTRRGVVRRLTDFGAFVDLGGVDGLLHVSEMGWGRVSKPSDVVKEGDEIEVVIIKIDSQKEKISLSLKGLLQDPWEANIDKYRSGMIIEGKVMRIAPFGAFIELEPGIEGLAHISQLAQKRVARVEDVLTVGQKVLAKIIEIEPEKKRISLSLKEIETDAEKAEYQTFLDKQPDDAGVTIGEMLRENNKELG